MRKLKDQLVGLDAKFRYRGLNQTRIETFSDAVFAFAFTLVVLSSSVPETFAELRQSFHDIIPFFFCVVLIVVIWYQHYLFFLRYGLQDTKTVVVNTFLLFLLLIYVYPLKFLVRLLFNQYYALFTGESTGFMNQSGERITADNMGLLMSAYGMGAALIFITLAWLYRHAYRRRTALELDPYEAFATRVSFWQNILMSAIPFLSACLAFLQPFQQDSLNFGVAGFIYMLYPPVMITFGKIMGKRSKAFEKEKPKKM